MGYDRVSGRVTIAAAATSAVMKLNCRSPYIVPLGFRASCVSDATTIIQLSDADGLIFYLDAGAISYVAAKDKFLVYDGTVTGLTTGIPTDLTGVAITTALGAGLPVVHAPVTVTWTSGTAADTLTFELYYKDGFRKLDTTLTTPTPAATVSKTVHLASKFARIFAFNFKCVTDASSKIKITDADSRVVYLDAADKDYHAAAGISKALVPDDTLTGITPQTLDATGAAMAATQTGNAGSAVVRSPINIEWSNNGTAGDVGTMKLYYAV